MPTKNDEISLKVPAYLRGELTPDEVREIENLAGVDPQFAAEIEFQRSLVSALKSETSDFTPGQMGWARLSKSMNSPVQDLPERHGKKWSSGNMWKYAAACLACIVVGQAGIWGSFTMRDDDEARYIPVSEEGLTSHVSTIAISGGALHSDITSLLQEIEAQIIEGPSALGLYQIAFETRSKCDAAVEVLETRPRLIETVSPCE